MSVFIFDLVLPTQHTFQAFYAKQWKTHLLNTVRRPLRNTIRAVVNSASAATAHPIPTEPILWVVLSRFSHLTRYNIYTHHVSGESGEFLLFEAAQNCLSAHANCRMTVATHTWTLNTVRCSESSQDSMNQPNRLAFCEAYKCVAQQDGNAREVYTTYQKLRG